jgi:hypothetical protein
MQRPGTKNTWDVKSVDQFQPWDILTREAHSPGLKWPGTFRLGMHRHATTLASMTSWPAVGYFRMSVLAGTGSHPFGQLSSFLQFSANHYHILSKAIMRSCRPWALLGQWRDNTQYSTQSSIAIHNSMQNPIFRRELICIGTRQVKDRGALVIVGILYHTNYEIVRIVHLKLQQPSFINCNFLTFTLPSGSGVPTVDTLCRANSPFSWVR